MNTRTAAMASTSRAPYERKEGEPSNPTKDAIQQFMGAWDQYKAANDARLAEIEKKGVADPLLAEKLGRIDRSLDAFEGMNQRLTTAEGQAKAVQESVESFKAILDTIETKMGRPGRPLNDNDRRTEMKTRANSWMRAVINGHQKGFVNLSEEEAKVVAAVEAEYKAMSIADDTTGGYLAPADFIAEIIKGVTEISPVRSLVRLRTTANRSIMVPKRTGQFAARRAMEQDTRTETTGLAYGLEEVTAPEMYAMVDISTQNLEDSAFDLEAEIRGEAEEQFAVKEGQEFVSGSSPKECEGILTNGQVAETITGTGGATSVTADGLLRLFYDIKTAYSRNASWVLNRVTLGSVRRLKDGDGQYLWMPGMAMGQPNSINGAPYVETPDMPNEAAGAYPVAFGDFRRAYTLVDRVAMSMVRDPFTLAAAGNVRYWFRRRVGGQVVLAEAIRKLKCSAS